jgi:uroporphyrinogen decarboxylase
MSAKPVVDSLSGKIHRIPPVWLMRQAGRYLPEYRTVRSRAGGFLDLCFTPDLAAEVTLQPIRRFGFDAAILFSDILVVPYALGQEVRFEEGEGPHLEAVPDRRGIDRLATRLDQDRLEPIYETIKLVKGRLPPGIALLGFCGSPWTLAVYMVAGRAVDGQGPARLFAYRDPKGFAVLIDRLVEASVEYLARQFEAGVDAVQLFDTWAGVLSPSEFGRWVIDPARRIVRAVRERFPGALMIGFPRGAGAQVGQYLSAVPVDGIGLDWTMEPSFARGMISRRTTIQGNLDPMALLAGGIALDRAVDEVLAAFRGRPFIFNLGHGIMPDTPIGHVEAMLARARRS